MSITYDFSGKVILITGSSSGIGAGTAILFAKSNANVVITGRNSENLSKVAKQCQQISPNNGSKVIQVLADLNNEEDIKRLVTNTINNFGKLDVLVNNGGINYNKSVNCTEYMKIHSNILNTNLNSAVYLTHLCIKYLAETKGNIINISSVAGHTPVKNFSSYCMSKCALDMFTRCMVVELADQNIRVNSINVGAVRTPILEKIGLPKEVFEGIYEKYAEEYPIGRAGEPEDIANAILFLASENTSYITGTNLVADGGHIAATVNMSPNLKNTK